MNVATTTSSGSARAGGTYPVLIIGALQPHAGKTGLAAAIALKLAYEGRRILALRLSGGDDAGVARADAEFFRTLPFARGRGGLPLSAEDAASAAEEQSRAGGLLILEAAMGSDLGALAGQLNAAVVLATRSADATAMQGLSAAASMLGPRLVGVAAVAVPATLTRPAEHALAQGPVHVLGVLPEDATLYAPSVLEIAEALDAEVVLGEPSESQIIERLLVGPITTDPGQPYYARSRSKKAIITRSDKPDLQLAAMHTDIDCLILTGGLNPSPYTIDRAADSEISVLLTQADTRGAVKLLEEIFTHTRFVGEEKLERMGSLLDQNLDWAPLRRALGA
jgi:BioD-like phosphotransacetylase family protein